MLLQNVSKRNFVLNIDGEICTVVPNAFVEIKDATLADDLINNYNAEWVEVKLPTAETGGQKAQKVIQNKTDSGKKKK